MPSNLSLHFQGGWLQELSWEPLFLSISRKLYQLYKLAALKWLILKKLPLAISIVDGTEEGHLLELIQKLLWTSCLPSPHICLSLPYLNNSFCSFPSQCHVSACFWLTLTWNHLGRRIRGTMVLCFLWDAWIINGKAVMPSWQHHHVCFSVDDNWMVFFFADFPLD